MADIDNKMEKIVSLCKRRGFIFQGSEIYGGLAGTWDYGPLGVMLRDNILREWWKMFVTDREDMYGINASILMNEKVWEASGHTGAGFSDPITECTKCHHRFRADHLSDATTCPDCGGALGEVRNFNLMFETKVGAEGTIKSYLRPETAQGIFVNFKNVVDTMSPKIPFGIAQVGKAFRNEIAPRDFLFRVREFEQMEIEYFVKEGEWEQQFEAWREYIWKWFDRLGLSRENIREFEVPENDLAHYSKRTTDFEYNYPGKGFDELSGFAYRTDHDLKSHQEASGASLEYIEPDGTRFIPHVLEPSFGLGRAITAVFSEAYTEDEMSGDVRTYLKLPVHLAPYRVAVSPLLKNKPELVERAREVFLMLKKEFGNIAWDDNGNIGKRYRRQDEIGTPYCVVIDFDTLGETPALLDTVTIRDRDTGEQTRVAISELVAALR
ncbi:glycine--tRNA ligase [Candidatus Kaiserbacteria bacterium RIFOXYB1_FULL_46_14]|uniref:glycine--tRNA ligase n=1 Tax=Candidatus Kaiserbacteria bacterium RIFOXYB1_FULL_46_14 TaxID=1798531 RepID=A0A1F6FIG3_9BACT|nr:MAG: glycine--tRNA ligase [Candidatus Kaiserbacteria bacterium RIFOXYB1_FULL_46_14]